MILMLATSITVRTFFFSKCDYLLLWLIRSGAPHEAPQAGLDSLSRPELWPLQDDGGIYLAQG